MCIGDVGAIGTPLVGGCRQPLGRVDLMDVTCRCRVDDDGRGRQSRIVVYEDVV